MMASITIKPATKLIDEPITVFVSGLAEHRQFTMAMRVEESQAMFISYGHYYSSEDGTIDLDKAPAVGGTYTGVDGMGLFWSMIPAEEHKEGWRLVQRDVTKPYRFELVVLQGHTRLLSFKEFEASQPIASRTIERWYYDDAKVTRLPVHHGRLRGSLFIPKQRGLYPGVLDVFGTGGGLMDFRAALLAAKGFITFHLAYFAYQDLPDNVNTVDMDYFQEAVQYLISHSSVCPGGIGVIGNSYGSELAIHLGIHNPQVVAVVGITGSYFRGIPATANGIVLSYTEQYGVDSDGNTYLKDLPRMFQDKIPALLDPRFVNPNSILNIEDTPSTSSYLLIQGEGDNTLGHYSYPILCERLKNVGKNIYEILSYPGAGHLIEPPYTPVNSIVYHRVFRKYMDYGGQPELHHRAQVHAWNKIQTFLKNKLLEPILTANM